MAACDYLHGNAEQWQELHDFLSKESPEDLRYMQPMPKHECGGKICYIASIQNWLCENCPLEWVKNELKDRFLVQRFILGKAHHEMEIYDY